MDEGADARPALVRCSFSVSSSSKRVQCCETTHLPVRKLAASVVHQRFRVNDGRRNTCLSADAIYAVASDLSGKLLAAGSGPPLSLLNQISELAYGPVSSKVAVMFPTA